MSGKRERVSLADLLGIQVLRRLDRNQPTYCADIDAPLAAEADRDHRGNLKSPVKVLADRADRVLQTRHGVSAGWLGEVVSWLRVLRFIGYLVALFIAFGIAEPWLREGETVNVEWLFGFLGTLIVSMSITTFLMILAGFSKRKDEDNPETPPVAGTANSFAKLLVVHWLIQFVIRRAIPWIEKRILKRDGEKSPEDVARIEKVSESLYDTLSQQSRRTALEAAATSNTVWFLVSLGVLLSLGKMGLFREYDFRWRATIVSEEFMLQTTQTLARPIAGFPMVSQPDEADVRWLATGEIPDGDDTTAHQQYRQLWGRLFLAYLLYYGVVPRFVLMVISRWLAARGWKSLRPNTKEPYFQTLLQNIEKPPFDSSQEEQNDSESSTSDSPSQPIRVAPKTTSAEESEAASATGNYAFVYSYDVEEPAKGWVKSLGLNGRSESLGNAKDRATRKTTQTTLQDRQADVGVLITVANLVDNPDGLFLHFLRETLAELPGNAGRALVLVGGERLRQRFDGDPRKIADRIQLWKDRATDVGIEPEKIVEYDLENITGKSRESLKREMQSILPHAKNGRTAEKETLQFAGQFRKAATVVIMSHIHEETAEQTPEELQKTTAQIHTELRSIYAKQSSALEKAFQNVSIDTNRIRSAISEKAGNAKDQLDKLEEFSRMTAVVQNYTKRLSGKWAIGGGVMCALGTGTLAALAAPALLPALIPAAAVGAQAGLVGSVLSAHAPHLAAKLRRHKPDDISESEDVPDEPTAAFSLDDLVRSSTLLALILELQGNSADLIAQTLEDIVTDLPEDDLNTPTLASQWLGNAADRVDDYLKNQPAA